MFSTIFRLGGSVLLAFVALTTLLLTINECVIAGPSRRTKDVAYVAANTPGFDAERHLLDVYAPRKAGKTPYPVVVFIHGGSWDSGSKNIYWFIGRRLAKQGVVAVVISYRLAPKVLVPDMANDCARAVAWTAQHIADYGGDPNRIYLMGHSAGGGLSALLAAKDDLFTNIGVAKNPVKGVILNDPAGLDMYEYLLKNEYPGDERYFASFGKDPAVWKSVSPRYFISPSTPKMMLFAGGRTYPSIATGTPMFHKLLIDNKVESSFKEIPGKKHVAMVTQLFWKNNVIYQDLLRFVGAQ
jgi:acetyl esterase/lipase